MAKEYRDVFNVETVLVNYRSEKYGWRRIPLLGQFSGSDGFTLAGSLIVFWILGYTPILWIPDGILNALSGLFSGGRFSLHLPATWLSIPLAFGFMFMSRKLEPQGKPMWKYMWDGSQFVSRSKVTNGWSAIPKSVVAGKKRTRVRDRISLLQGDSVPLPAVWRGEGRLLVRVPFRATVQDGRVTLFPSSGRRGEAYLPGEYIFEKESLESCAKH